MPQGDARLFPPEKAVVKLPPSTVIYPDISPSIPTAGNRVTPRLGDINMPQLKIRPAETESLTLLRGSRRGFHPSKLIGLITCRMET